MNPALNLSFKTFTTALADIACDALIVGVYSKKPAANAAKTPSKTAASKDLNAPAASLALLNTLAMSPAATADVPTAVGKTHTVYPAAATGIKAARVICVGLGDDAKFDAKAYAKALRAALGDCANAQVKTVAIGLHGADLAGLSVDVQAQHAASLAHEVCYRYDETLSKKASPRALATLLFPAASAAQAKLALAGAARGNAIGAGASLCRELGNLPANICTPTYLGQQAMALAKTHKMDCKVLDTKQLKALKMGSFLSVAAGSDQPPCLIVMEYKGGKKDAAPHVLVGKGVTFDTGGISLKPGEGMDEMKYDMCGAASVLGAMQAVAAMKLAINVVAIIPATENMPNGHATKPGDVVTSMSGQTIEVLNTDAEGRLILCDALTYAQRFKPASVIDIATLTGACIIALGSVHSALYANNEPLAAQIQAASATSLDTAWRMPLDEVYHEQLKSNFADTANIGGRPAGSVTAACFLAKFTQSYPWVHLDIAGTAWRSGATKGATGRPVGLLVQYLMDRAA